MIALLASAPLITVILLIASRRVAVPWAGVIGWVLAVAVAAWLRPEGGGFGSFTLIETLKGAWISWQAIAVILGGLFFYRAIRRDSGARGAAILFSPRWLWAICFLIGPFIESATGFGVGCVVALAALQRMGLTGISSVVLALYSQTLVPWGALAIGTLMGASLARLDDNHFAFASAVLQAPLLLGYLPLYWHFAKAAGHRIAPAQKRDDLLWTVAIVCLLPIISRFVAAELGAIATTGLLILVRHWRDERPDLASLRRSLMASAPYVALSLALIASRTIPPLAAWLRTAFLMRPFPELRGFAPFYTPGFWLIAVALGVLALEGRVSSLGRILGETGRSAWRPVLVTFLFIAMAQILTAAGAAAIIAAALSGTLGDATLLASPPLGAVGGFLTGSYAASSGLILAAGGMTTLWPVALQNVSACNFTLLSPIRVTMGTTLIGLGGNENEVYREAWPIAVMLAVGLLLEAGVMLAVG